MAPPRLVMALPRPDRGIDPATAHGTALAGPARSSGALTEMGKVMLSSGLILMHIRSGRAMTRRCGPCTKIFSLRPLK